MSFETYADRQNGYYGVWKKDNNGSKFHKLGYEIRLNNITENLETGSTELYLSFDFNGTIKVKKIPRKLVVDSRAFLGELADAGADVTPKYANVIWDTIRQQQEIIEANQGVRKVYEHLGWKRLLEYDSVGNPMWNDCYRASQLIGGGTQAEYTGPYVVAPVGYYDDWKEMVRREVIGHTALEVVLLFGLAAVVNGLIAPYTTGENPILHLNGKSSTGKSTACELAVSTTGVPFAGSTTSNDPLNGATRKNSLYSSWGATENATIARCAGNRGAVVVLNELGKFGGFDMTRIVYNLSEGTDKERLTTELKSRQSETYFTTFISSGEISLLEQCKKKAEGLQIRVMELEQPLTDDAAHADRIKQGCKASNGHAAPMLAQFILDNGGLDYVLPIYKGYCQSLVNAFAETPMRGRFIEKFPALILTTAEIAQEALGITFDKQGILEVFQAYYKERIAQGNVAGESYNVIIEECRKNINCFYQPQCEPPRGKVYGKITKPGKQLPDGRWIVEEYAVYKSVVDAILMQHGFQNKRTCIQAWKDAGVLDHDADRPTRSRKIGKSKAEVYVFRVFGDVSEANREDTEGSTFKYPRLRVIHSKGTASIESIFPDDDEEEGENEKNDESENQSEGENQNEERGIYNGTTT